ncbi:hypothetical protein FLA105534_01643 [Flavobacterium bizetiae]|uniref:Uncharacterized protein n=2 Tax=Flavobacterium bizetiae TaxID=2704140 RepID=A0A6J4GE61_9FLAO|nr:hypothetical protein FLA105534_01643 [Flavobacterium bizetiae]CAD5342994.1 hypothetical protein FLA105535_02992 [Flavobacterium bizetiae]CAD5350475.1 hypothetical protein FLA105534_04465 [Flavobacterium bizetiae]
MNKKYQSGLIANTDLHAGGLFFCIIYQNQLEFFENGKVELTKKVVDAFRPMDENDVEHLKNFNIVGDYSFNDRGYLVCKFEDLFWTFTGLSSEKDSSIIAFNIYDRRLQNKWGEVYKLEEII